ncbi:MAG: protein jag [Eubacterium sp.]|nr:protein jag [Eubacterium sp.]
MDYIEFSAKTVEDAITKACLELAVSSDRLEIQIISEGSSGFLGFGSKPAVIKVKKLLDEEEMALLELEKEKAAAKEAVKAAEKAAEETVNERYSEEAENVRYAEEAKPEKTAGKKSKNRKNKKRPKADRKPDVAKEAVKPVKKERKEETVPVRTEEEIAVMKADAKDFLEKVFAAMEIEAEFVFEYNETDGSLNIDFEGDDMGVLIGKRGQTLDSLQYLTSLVVNKNCKDHVRVKLDTEDYRKRRKETLENLAKNIASKVKKTGKSVVLEPMNPYERRIIHSAIQPNKYVETYSEGNEPYRHVVVTLKKQ